MSKKNILFLTVNFPPNPTVGTRRVSKVLKYLDYDKFKISVLTLSEKYYNSGQGSQTGDMQKIPEGIRVYRTDMRDLTSFFTRMKAALKNLSGKNKKSTSGILNSVQKDKPKPAKKGSVLNKIRSILFSFLEFPDKYIGWAGKAIREGKRIIRDEQIDVVFTTAPPHSIFLIAAVLKKRTGVKLVVDFRDPWALASWIDTGGVKQFIKKRLEKFVVENADLLVFVTDKLLKTYQEEYTQIPAEKFKLFSNGFDPDDFNAEDAAAETPPRAFVRIVHLGTLYKKRNPMPFIEAIEQLKDEGFCDQNQFRVDFIGTLTQRFSGLPEEIKNLKLDAIIRFIPSISFKESIRTMYDADILLLIQPETLMQIPAKLFEYMYTRRPIFAIAEPESAVEQIIAEGGLGVTAVSGEVADIKEKFIQMFQYIKTSSASKEAYIESFNYAHYVKKIQHYLETV